MLPLRSFHMGRPGRTASGDVQKGAGRRRKGRKKRKNRKNRKQRKQGSDARAYVCRRGGKDAVTERGRRNSTVKDKSLYWYDDKKGNDKTEQEAEDERKRKIKL